MSIGDQSNVSRLSLEFAGVWRKSKQNCEQQVSLTETHPCCYYFLVFFFSAFATLTSAIQAAPTVWRTTLLI